MNLQFLSDERGKKTAVVIPLKDWEEIQVRLKQDKSDSWDDLPQHVINGIERGKKQSDEGETKSHSEVMLKYDKYL